MTGGRRGSEASGSLPAGGVGEAPERTEEPGLGAHLWHLLRLAALVVILLSFLWQLVRGICPVP